METSGQKFLARHQSLVSSTRFWGRVGGRFVRVTDVARDRIAKNRFSGSSSLGDQINQTP